MCVYVCIYITTIRVPSFPLRSFPKGSGASNQSVARRTPRENLKYEFMNSRVCVCVCVSFLSLSLVWWCCYFFVVAFFLWLFGRFFSPRAARNVVIVSFSFSRVLSWFFEHAHSICAQRRQTDTLRAERKRESFWRQKKSFRERDEMRDEMKKNETFCVGGVVYVE